MVFSKFRKLLGLGPTDVVTQKGEIGINSETQLSLPRQQEPTIEETKKSVADIIDNHFLILSQYLNTEQPKTKSKKTKMDTRSSHQELSPRDIAQLIYHSFRFSNGSVALQFSMLYLAWKKYGPQIVNQDECEEVFRTMIGLQEPTVKQHEDTERSGRVYKWTTYGNQPFQLSETNSHVNIFHTSARESSMNSPFFTMLLKGEGYLSRSNRDGMYSISRDRELEYSEHLIEKMFRNDFGYIAKKERKYNPDTKEYETTFPGRPNRLSSNDGKNNMKDRYFSYFVWFIIQENRTGNDFFDEYFLILREHFKEWFNSLPRDGDLPKHTYSFRKRSESSYNETSPITKEDVLYLIAVYNITHPDTEIDIKNLA